MESLLAGIICG